MKKLAGTSWGAKAKILRQVYTGAFRPVAEEAQTRLKNSFRADWRTKNSNYNPEQDHINQLTRQGQTIFRLRTGHCGLRKHMKKMGLVDTASCQCDGTQKKKKKMSSFKDARDQKVMVTVVTVVAVGAKCGGFPGAWGI
nr:hypothetical protein BaRGS_024492 [Batillaria attramentaria]